METVTGTVLTQRPEKHGAIYTRPWVVEWILDLAGYDPQANLVDALAIEPAVGNGAFLLPMVRRLIVSCQRQGRPLTDCGSSLIAFEIDPFTATLTRQEVAAELRNVGAGVGEASQLASGWVHTADALLALPQLPLADFVIGNPPYVRLEDVSETTMSRYRALYSTMIGRADLYIAFFEAGLKQLKPGGVCAYICADRWMLNQYGAMLRQLITASYSVETTIELHSAETFEATVSAYPAITTIRRAPQGPTVVARAGNETAQISGTILTQAVTHARMAQEVISLPGWRATRIAQWFTGNQPWPRISPERLALLRRLEEEFYPLESVGTATRVGIGVATGADDTFITANPTLVEPARLLPVALARDITSGHVRWSGHYLVNPWEGEGLVSLATYPQFHAYVQAHQVRLAKRHVGRKQPKQWYRTIDRVDPRLVRAKKLYIADIQALLNPVLDNGETYPHHNLYVITSGGWDIEVLGGLLLSEVAQFFIECYAVRMRGGYLRFQAQYLRRIRVPRPHDLTPEQHEGLRAAFRQRDRIAATALASAIYRIDHIPQEEAL